MANISQEFIEQCIELCRQGKHMTAHRLYMGEVGCSALEAQNGINKICRDNGIDSYHNTDPSRNNTKRHNTSSAGLSKKTMLILTLATIIMILAVLYFVGE